MKKLFEKKTICVLSPSYFKDVMETASLFTILPYHSGYAQNAWYWKYLFWRKDGYLLTGFKTNLPGKREPYKSDILIPELVDMINTLEKIPIEMIFVPKNLYNKVECMKSKACILEVSQYGVVRIKHPEYKKFTEFCVVASSFVKELSDEELWKVKSIDGIVAGDEG